MKIFHTADWHLGKTLEGHSRIEEQIEFLEFFIGDVEERNPQGVLIAGDIFDTVNPPAQAERLYYDAIKRIADNGKRLVVIISGNHDSPERLDASKSLTGELGIVVMGMPMAVADRNVYEGFEIYSSGPGWLKVRFNNGEKLTLIALPYPSERRLNLSIDYDRDEKMQTTYSNRIGEIFKDLEKQFEDDTVNLCMSHIFVAGGDESDSERSISLGGSFLVFKDALPEKSQYTALGHLHKPQRISKAYNAYYSGSPLQYSKTERASTKFYNSVTVNAGEVADVEKIPLPNIKPITVLVCESVDEAVRKSEELKDESTWVYMEIKTEEAIPQDVIKTLKANLAGLLEIKPIFVGEAHRGEVREISTMTDEEMFKDFYKRETSGAEADDEIVNLFLSLLNGEEERDEAGQHNN